MTLTYHTVLSCDIDSVTCHTTWPDMWKNKTFTKIKKS